MNFLANHGARKAAKAAKVEVGLRGFAPLREPMFGARAFSDEADGAHAQPRLLGRGYAGQSAPKCPPKARRRREAREGAAWLCVFRRRSSSYGGPVAPSREALPGLQEVAWMTSRRRSEIPSRRGSRPPNRRNNRHSATRGSGGEFGRGFCAPASPVVRKNGWRATHAWLSFNVEDEVPSHFPATLARIGAE